MKLTEDALRENKTADLGYIQENYKALQQIILLEEKNKNYRKRNDGCECSFGCENSEIDAADEASSPIDAALSINSSENKALTEQYTEFLARKPVVPEHQKRRVSLSRKLNMFVKPSACQPKKLSEPYAIVVLGGGLTLDKMAKIL